MSKDSVITQAAFDRMLAWLDSDRERAGKRYESIRRRLVEIFAGRGFAQAEELADETINRVTLKAEEVVGGYVGDPAHYFYAIAKKIMLENYKVRRPAVAPPPPPDADELEREHACLERCLGELADADRDCILRYYREERRAKIDLRREMAQAMGVAPNALRIRVHRMKCALKQCMKECLGKQTA